MTDFQGKRVAREYQQHNVAPPEKVFPLLCPVREGDWLPGWEYRLIFSQSGVAETGCVFSTPNEGGTETTWVVTQYDPGAFRIAFTWVNPGRVAAQIVISLERNAQDTTDALIRYVYTGLTPSGNREVECYSQEWFQAKMEHWETCINHYLRTGKLISESTSE
jgi:hypothetical protein